MYSFPPGNNIHITHNTDFERLIENADYSHRFEKVKS